MSTTVADLAATRALRSAPASSPVAPPARARTWVAPTAIALGALALRLPAGRGLWVDEGISVYEARMSFGAMLHELATTDLQPPLHHTTLWLSLRIFGSSEFSIRFPSLIASMLLVVALYHAGCELYDRRTGLVAMSIAAVAPLTVWYAQDARMYSLEMAWCALATWFLFRAIRTEAISDWALLAAAGAAAIWTQYTGGFFVAAIGLVVIGLLVLRLARHQPVAKLFRRTLIGGGVLAVLVAPLVPYAYQQLTSPNYTAMLATSGSVGAAHDQGGITFYGMLTNLLVGVVGYHSDRAITLTLSLWPMAVLAALLALGRGPKARSFVLVLLAAVPFFGVAALAADKPDFFAVRYICPAVPVLLLLGARLITRLTVSTRLTAIVTGIIVVLLLGALADQQLSPDNPRRYDFREAFAAIHATPHGDTATVVFYPIYLHEVAQYYAPDNELLFGGERDPLPRHGRVFVLGSHFDVHGMYREVGGVIAHVRDSGRKIRREWRFTNVRLWELR